FDIYPVVHDRPEVSGKLWYVAAGVERLIKWTGGKKPVWNCLECTRISHPTAKPTPAQLRAEAWMSIIHGSRGLIWVVHEWKPRFNESALLEDPPTLEAVTGINKEIIRLAPVIYSPAIRGVVSVKSSTPTVPIAFMPRSYDGTLHLFAVTMRSGETEAEFKLTHEFNNAEVEVIGENRELNVQGGFFTDHFTDWQVHLYKIKPAS
ncbi:MAG: hypothetical protein N3G20_01480, partial [Verrucomicrobiae bacterium]|nr:hypothetical protein [Verrucomicrobiae bacterium]